MTETIRFVYELGLLKRYPRTGWLQLGVRTPESVAPVAEALGAELAWDGERIRSEAEAWPAAAAIEGIDPAKLVTSTP